MTLNQVKPGNGGTIVSIGGNGALRHHLLDMGLTPGTRVQVRRVAPMGDPMELVLRGYVLTIRMIDAEKITLIQTNNTDSIDVNINGQAINPSHHNAFHGRFHNRHGARKGIKK